MSGPDARVVVDRYDAALFDLDGVVYLGPTAVPGAAEGLSALCRRGISLGFVTNNAARPPGAVAEHLRALGIEATDQDVVTSSQAAAQLLAARFAAGDKVLVVGGDGILAALAETELVPVRSADDDPVAVLQGFSFDLTWDQLNEAAIAIQRGAHWVATNTDSTRPTDRGIVPGNGAAVDAVRAAVDAEPEVAGKPFPPLLDEAVSRLAARRPILVGDRIDTDIAGAAAVGIDSLLVFSGAHGPRELLDALATQRPTHIGLDLRALLLPERVVRRDGRRATCGTGSAVASDTELVLETAVEDSEDALDALWALAQLHWEAVDQGHRLDAEAVLELLTPLT